MPALAKDPQKDTVVTTKAQKGRAGEEDPNIKSPKPTANDPKAPAPKPTGNK